MNLRSETIKNNFLMIKVNNEKKPATGGCEFSSYCTCLLLNHYKQIYTRMPCTVSHNKPKMCT